jgi:ribosomal protein S18 acetylase RimI-like enzyme
MVELVPMTPEQYRAFIEVTVQGYADDHVRAGTWTAADALTNSRAELDRLLPNGPDTPAHFLRTIVAGAPPTRVGTLWWAIRQESSRVDLYVYWIGIDEEFRRRGYAAETFGALEREARRAGAARIVLHVFGDNLGARALYEKIGFRATNVLMARPVAPESDPPAPR